MKKLSIAALYLSIFLIFAVGCDREPEKLTLIVSAEEPAPSIGLAITELLNAKQFNIILKSHDKPQSFVDMILQGDADLAIIEEPESMTKDIYTVMPLYPSILHVLYLKGQAPKNFTELIKGKTIYTGSKGGTASRLLHQIASGLGMDQNDYKIVLSPWPTAPDVYFIFGGLLNEDSVQRLDNYQLFSFGDTELLGTGTFADGIALKLLYVKPFILPDQIYGNLSNKPILTLATRSVLIASNKLSSTLIYDINDAITDKSQLLTAQYSLSLNELINGFNPKQLIFPLHDGAKRFMNRDLPNIIERNVDVISLLGPLILSIISGIYGLLKYHQHKKKDRIDFYFHEIISLREQIASNIENYQEIGNKIKAIQQEVMQKVIDETLNADESLSVFFSFSNQVLLEINILKKDNSH